MSAFTATRAVRAMRSSPALSRPFTTGLRLSAGKESNLHRDDHADQLDAARKEQSKDGKWKEILASESEGNVRADRENADKSISQLQKETAETANKDK